MYLKQLFKFTLHDMVINIFIIAQQMCGILSVNDTDLCTCVLYIHKVSMSVHKKTPPKNMDLSVHTTLHLTQPSVLSEQINYSSVIINHSVCRALQNCRMGNNVQK